MERGSPVLPETASKPASAVRLLYGESAWSLASAGLGALLVGHSLDSSRIPLWGLGAAVLLGLASGFVAVRRVERAHDVSTLGTLVLATLALNAVFVERDFVNAALLASSIALSRRLRFPALFRAAWTAAAAGGVLCYALTPTLAPELAAGRLSLGFQVPSQLAWLSVASVLVQARFSALNVLSGVLAIASGARVPIALFALVMLGRAARRHVGLLVLALVGIAVIGSVLAATRGVEDVGSANGRSPIWAACAELAFHEYPRIHTVAEVSAFATERLLTTEARYQLVFDCHQSYLDVLLRFGLAAPAVIALLVLRQAELVGADAVMALAFAGVTLVSSQLVEPLAVHTLVFLLYRSRPQSLPSLPSADLDPFWAQAVQPSATAVRARP